MKDHKDMIVYKKDIFSKIKHFFCNLFKKNVQFDIVEQSKPEICYIGRSKKQFNDYISFKDNKDDLRIINEIKKSPDILVKMNMDELDNIEKAIINRTRYIDKKIEKIKMDLMLQKKNFLQ